MRIGGFTPFSLSDFPGRVAAVVFAQGCNFRCPFCHNGSLLPETPAGGALLPAGALLEGLARRRGQLDGVVVSGGEPTLQEGLPAFLDRLKGMGFATKLDTNGSRPGALAALLRERLVDYVAMDVKAPPALYGALCGVPVDWQTISECIDLIARSGLPHQFRTTVVPALLGSAELARLRAQVPPGSPHVWQLFRPERVLNPAACGIGASGGRPEKA